MSKPGWQARLTGLIALVLGALLLFQLLYVIPYVKDREVQQEQAHQEAIVRNVAHKLDSDLTEPRDRLIGISGRAEFAGMDIASQQRTLDSFVEGSRRVMSMTVLNAEGWLVAASGMEVLSMLTTMSYADEPYFHVPFEQGQLYRQEPRFYPSEQLLSVVVSMPIESDEGERVGVLLGTLKLNHVVDLVADYPLEEGMEIIVVDMEGTVVAHSGIDLFALEEGPLSLDYRHDTIVQAVMAGELGVPPVHDHDGVPYYGAYTILESNGWGVLTNRPMSLVLAEANALSRWLLAANAALFAIALLIALLLARQIMAGESKAVRELSVSEEKFRELFEQSMDAVALVAVDGTLLDANPAYLRLYGLNHGAIGHSNVRDSYVRAADHDAFLQRMEQCGAIRDEEVSQKKAGGTNMDCLRTSIAIRDEAGRIVRLQSVVRDITERKKAQEQLEEGHAQVQRMLQGTLEVIEQMTEARDPYTAGHQRRVSELSTAIARQLKLPEESCVAIIRMAALIHDIGKVSVPAELLTKPGKLSDSEFALIKIHPQVGCDILKGAELPDPVAEAVLQHHERVDGSGYPQGLSGDDILPEATILAVADVVEAMSSHRPYRPALGIEAALEEVSSGSGIRYDPDVAAACLAVFRQEGFTFSS